MIKVKVPIEFGYKASNEAIACANGQHEFEKINEGNVRCKKCGRFAKVGHMYFDSRRAEE